MLKREGNGKFLCCYFVLVLYFFPHPCVEAFRDAARFDSFCCVFERIYCFNTASIGS